MSQEEHEAFFRQMLGDVDEPTAPFGLLDVQATAGEIEEARLRWTQVWRGACGNGHADLG